MQSRNYQCQIKRQDPQPVYQNREPHYYNPLSIYATTIGRNLVSYLYQAEARNVRTLNWLIAILKLRIY